MFPLLSPQALLLAAISAFAIFRYAASGKHHLAESALLAVLGLAIAALPLGAPSGIQQAAANLFFVALAFAPLAGFLSPILPIFFGGAYGPFLSAVCFLIIFRNRESAIAAPILLSYYASMYLDWGLFISGDLNRAAVFLLLTCLSLSLSALLLSAAIWVKARLPVSSSRGSP